VGQLEPVGEALSHGDGETLCVKVLDPVRLTVDVPEELRHRVGVGLTVAETLGLLDTERVSLAQLEGEALRHRVGDAEGV